MSFVHPVNVPVAQATMDTVTIFNIIKWKTKNIKTPIEKGGKSTVLAHKYHDGLQNTKDKSYKKATSIPLTQIHDGFQNTKDKSYK